MKIFALLATFSCIVHGLNVILGQFDQNGLLVTKRTVKFSADPFPNEKFHVKKSWSQKSSRTIVESSQAAVGKILCSLLCMVILSVLSK